ncbi:member of Set1p complex, histone methyl transferase [Agyrium rufum]|nr:member of Set1p complex, histone methyl transferase [Agyrium rufum]
MATPIQGVQPAQKTSDCIGSLRPVKLFKLNKPETVVTSLDFDDSGELLLAACSDDSLQLYNTREGKHVKTLLSKKYGCHLARFTHNSQSIIYASTKGDDEIRYLSTNDNQFLRYFKGHTAPVTELAVSPADNTFLSCSLDNTVRLWSLDSPTTQGRLNINSPLHAAYDPSATVFAVACPLAGCIFLYDIRNYDKPPFATFNLHSLESHPQFLKYQAEISHGNGRFNGTSTYDLLPRDWTKMEFSNDGTTILVGTNSPIGHFLISAFDGSLRAFLVRSSTCQVTDLSEIRSASYGPEPGAQAQGALTFSADGRYVIGSGSESEAVIWDLQGDINFDDSTIVPIGYLPHNRRVGIVEWNPRYNMLASAEKEVVMWLPDEHAKMKTL